MKIGRGVVLFAALLFSGNALAQIGCPPGYFPIVQGPTNQTVTTCVPEGDAGFGNYGDDSSDAPTVPAVQWVDRWGAIAVSRNSVVGVSVDAENERGAQKAAITDCRKRGGSGCEVQIAYYNQCAALAVSGHNFTASREETEEKAISSAVKDCSAENGDSCRVYYSGCSLPARVQ